MTREIPLEDHLRQQIKFTTCYMCACRCGIKVTLEDGKVRFIQGNRNHPVNQGVLCAKGAAGIMKQYSPARGGFCAVNMAVAGLYTIGYSFWEFGAPDWDHAKYFLLWGVAEDHSSNPIKIGLDKLKRRGAKFVSINPVRTGYSAIADEWVPIRPGTDGLFALALAHVLIKRGLVDWEFLIKYTNAPWLVVQTPGMPGDGLFARDAEGNPLVWDQEARRFANGHLPGIAPALLATVELPDGRRAKTVFSLATERYLDDRYSPDTVAAECVVPAETIHRIALEMAQ